MKIDFNENGMTINFDKVPKFLYFNEESKGCGQVFLDGVRRKGLQEIKMQAETRDFDGGWPPLKYRIQYQEPKTSEPQFISNMKEELCIGIKIRDTKEFADFLACVKEIINDVRIPEAIRQEYAEKIIATIKPDYVLYADSGIYDFGMEGKDNDIR